MPRHLLEKIDLSLQLIFVVAILCVLTAKYNTKLAGFLKYGKTLALDTSKEETNANFALRFALELKVSKFWFFHFYVLSLVLSVVGFIITHSKVLNNDTSHPFSLPELENIGTIPLEISRLAFFLIIGHSSRRLIETCMVFNYKKTSKMNISHYLVGLFFYTSLNLQLFLNTDFLGTITASQFDIRLLLSLILFLFASTDQFVNHLHLSKVVKYNVPRYALFKYVCCAHYLDEILIYTAVFGVLRTRTSFLGLLFVIVNLSTSAIETRNYYKAKADSKVPKWAIIPFVL